MWKVCHIENANTLINESNSSDERVRESFVMNADIGEQKRNNAKPIERHIQRIDFFVDVIVVVVSRVIAAFVHEMLKARKTKTFYCVPSFNFLHCCKH